MRVALTGVSGFLGSVIARHLFEAGHEITGLVRQSSRRDHIEQFVDRFVVGAHDDRGCWPALLMGADCVIHNSVDWTLLRRQETFEKHLQTNLVASLGLLRDSAPRQFIFTSTIAVNHDMRPRWEGLIDEDHPTRPSSDYGAFKASVEAHLWSEHFGNGRHTSAIRPCAVYGMDPNLERTIGYPIIKRVYKKRSFTKQGGGKFVHVDDVAAAAVAIVGNPVAAGKAYNMADCYARWGDWAQMAADELGIEANVDLTSPDQPRNTFTKAGVNSLGVSLDRGHGGIRDHLRELVGAMELG